MAETIFARSTAPGRAGIAVVRLSGERSHEAVTVLSRQALPPPRQLRLRYLWFGEEKLDSAMVVVFEGGASFTGESCAELHLHGSEAVVRAVLRVLSGMPGMRGAEPGEFTRRALENDCLDLAQIEGLGALLEAETEAQRRQAMAVLSGDLGTRVSDWRDVLLDALAEVEVTVDFADEEVPREPDPVLVERLGRLSSDLKAQAKGAAQARSIASGFEVAIVGPPNAGKSTLLNRLAGREAALTSEVAGTTRDVIEVRMELGGQFLTFLDTAGIREAEEEIEAAGVTRAVERANAADLRVFIDEVPAAVDLKAGDLVVSGKADLNPAPGGRAVSGITGEGVEELLGEISRRLNDRVSGAGLMITERQAACVTAASCAIDDARRELASSDANAELVAENLRGACRALDQLVGRIGVEDVLGRIFSSFCIGK